MMGEGEDDDRIVEVAKKTLKRGAPIIRRPAEHEPVAAVDPDAAPPSYRHAKRAHRYRIYPTPEQAAYLRRCMGAARWLYNHLAGIFQADAMERRKRAIVLRVDVDANGDERAVLKWPRMEPWHQNAPYELMVAARVEQPWLLEVPSEFLNCVCAHFRTAISRMYQGGGSPTRKKYDGRGTVQISSTSPVQSATRNLRVGVLSIPAPKGSELDRKIRVRAHRPLRGAPGMVTIIHYGGRWWATVLDKWLVKLPSHRKPGTLVGVDVNVVNLAVTSDGRRFEHSPRLARLETRKRRAQRIVSRRYKAKAKPQSQRYYKARMRLSRLSAEIAELRREVIEQVTHDLASNYETIRIEDISIQKMTKSARGTLARPGKNVRKKARRNASILNASWYKFRVRLEAKARQYGGKVELVDPAWSTLACSTCGLIGKLINRSTVVCRKCGEIDSDFNAALNIAAGNPASSSVGPAGAARGGLGGNRPAKREGRIRKDEPARARSTTR